MDCVAREGFTGKQPKQTPTVWERECAKGPTLGHRRRGEGGLAEKNQEPGTKGQQGATDGFSVLEWHQI